MLWNLLHLTMIVQRVSSEKGENIYVHSALSDTALWAFMSAGIFSIDWEFRMSLLHKYR
ncbi:hypothetical protein AURDEDRAFT_173349 [Auricularia subglabra TFB-10046 SS5]|nr:hypothetical protein AURDEDRAFT_173349 [Auricularia subglabra TFB-10046 SS5]